MMPPVRITRLILPVSASAIAAAVLFFAATVVAREGGGEQMLVSAASIAPGALGVLALTIGPLAFVLQRRLRVGSTPSCRRCGYPYPDSEKIVTACCECGAPWRWYGGLVRGRPVYPERVRRLGLAAAIVGVPLLALALTPTSTLVSVAPTPVITARLAIAPDVEARVWWDELDDRPISDASRERIAIRLLDRAAGGNALGPVSEDWLSRSIVILPPTSVAVTRHAAEILNASTPATLTSRAPATGTALTQAAAPAIKLELPPAAADAAPAPSLDEFLASFEIEPGALTPPRSRPTLTPGRRVGVPADMRRDGWLDDLLGTHSGDPGWPLGPAAGRGWDDPIPPPQPSLHEVFDGIEARRAATQRLHRRIHLNP